jgi:hypothetical protein
MTINTDKLLSISSTAIAESIPQIDEQTNKMLGSLGNEFHNILSIKNGFYAFESALHFFPATEVVDSVNLDVNYWNSPQLWRDEYSNSIDKYLFFAEDIFGGQFCIFNNKIHIFDSETEEIEVIADTFDDWAKCILDNYNYLTGFELAHGWQLKNGSIPAGKRLLPKVPFVLGGKFTVDNLYLLDSVTGMKLRGDLAQQIKNSPDGTKITFKIVK